MMEFTAESHDSLNSMKSGDLNNDVTVTSGRAVARFDPKAALSADAKANAIIEYAQRMKDWPLLEVAVDEKIEQQREFVGWWAKNISIRHGGDRKSSAQNDALDISKAEELTGITHQQVSKWRRWLARETEYRAAIYGAAYKKAIAQDQNYRAEGTGQNEWYTPARYIEAARSVMGSIDLDPASCDEAQAVVGAAEFFTKESDGLAREWRGNVWINPPFSRDLIALFTNKLIAEFSSGRVAQAILLTHNNTDTEWFHLLAYASAAICFTRGRVPFFRGDWIAAPPNGQAFFYLGHNQTAFTGVFATLGLVMPTPAAIRSGIHGDEPVY